MARGVQVQAPLRASVAPARCRPADMFMQRLAHHGRRFSGGRLQDGAPHGGLSEPTLYERLGGAFAIAAVVDHFSDAVLASRVVGVGAKNPLLKQWATRDAPARLAGLKFMRTLWVCSVAGGPFTYAGQPLAAAHRALRITPEEFDEVAAQLGRSLDHFLVPASEKAELMAAFAKEKAHVTQGALVARH